MSHRLLKCSGRAAEKASACSDRLVAGEMDGDTWSVRDGVATPTAPPEDSVDANTAVRVAELARQLEARFSTPLDIEWALAGERLVVLQARPITAVVATGNATKRPPNGLPVIVNGNHGTVSVNRD